MRWFKIATPAILLMVAGSGCMTFTGADGTIRTLTGLRAPVWGSGQITSEERPVADFVKIEASQGIVATVEKGSQPYVLVEADDNILPMVVTEVSNKTLNIHIRGSIRSKNPIQVRVVARDIESLEASSGAKIKATGVWGNRLTAKASSAGSIEAEGQVDRLNLKLSSAADFHGPKLQSRAAKVNISSAASAVINASDEIDGSTSSAGTLEYYGSPKALNVKTSSAGTFKPAVANTAAR